MFESWYADIGEKIKNWAIWCFIIEALGAIITGIVFLTIDEDLYLWAFLLIFLGPLVAFVGSWLLYGFGELIDKVCEIARNTGRTGNKSETQSKIDSERISRLEKLRAQGLITEEEYQKAISKEQ